jgi:hypothetical protein
MVRKFSEIAVVATLLAGLMAACGGSDPEAPSTLPSKWAPADVREVRALADRSESGAAGCAAFSEVPASALAGQQERFGWRAAPSAVGDCDRGDEIIEYATFDTRRERDAFIAERTSVLCRRAAAVAAPIPPFAWVRGEGRSAWSAQADSKVSAMTIARRLGGSVEIKRCDLTDTLGWRQSGVESVRALAFKISSAGIRCAGFSIVDRATLRGVGDDRKVPSAVGTCTTGDSSTPAAEQSPPMVVAAFDARSQSRAAFVRDALGPNCAAGSVTVVGEGWAVIAPTASAAQVAGALGGASAGGC